MADKTILDQSVLTKKVDIGNGLFANAVAVVDASGTHLTTFAGTEFAEDSAHTTGDKGIQLLAVRADTAAATAANGDYVPLLVDGSGRLWVNPAITAASGAIASGAVASGAVASGAIASGAVASGAIASGAVASGAIASGAVASGAVVDGAVVTLGAKADAKSTATDTTAVSLMQVAKQLSASVQELAAAVTPLGQAAMAASVPVTMASDQSDIKVTLDSETVAIASIAAGTNNIGDVDVASLPSGNLGQKAMAASLSTVPASDITANTYIGDVSNYDQLITLASSAARTESGNGTAVESLGGHRRYIIVCDITASATAAGDTLDVYVDVSPDGTNWVNAVHFTQQAGDGAARKEVAILDPANPGTSVIDVTADAAAGATRPALFGQKMRARWVLVDGGGGDTSHTFSVVALAQ